jgi:hypothetical protein
MNPALKFESPIPLKKRKGPPVLSLAVTTPEAVDSCISTEFPDADTQPSLLELVKKHMVHGPCGRPYKCRKAAGRLTEIGMRAGHVTDSLMERSHGNR